MLQLCGAAENFNIGAQIRFLPYAKTSKVCRELYAIGYTAFGVHKLANFDSFLGCIKCMRCRLLLLMSAVSVRQSVSHAAQLGVACSVCGAFAAAFAKL